MTLTFLTPYAALVGLGALATLGALVAAERRSRRVCRALGLVPLPAVSILAATLALLLVAGLLALAAAQPVVAEVHPSAGRRDAEVLLVLDISRSMLARGSPRELSRFDRARSLMSELRAELPGVPVGIASLTDGVLPHLFPTTNEAVFAATLSRSVGIERPPPDRSGRGRATVLGALASLGTRNFFTPGTAKRVAVVLTDGESLPVATGALASAFAEGAVTPIFARLWAADERIFDAKGRPLPAYLADPDSAATLDSVASAVGGRVFGESDLSALVRTTRAALGSGPTGPAGRQLQSLELAPYAVLGAFVPLLFLVWRRNLTT